MQHKIFLLFSCVLWFVGTTEAQDIEPSQMAQGYLSDKNVMVDHATGIFRYKIPLYTLHSGDFKLPVYLGYVAKGVREEDQSGLIGLNWTLNTGGVVTRTVRGGIADDDLRKGYLFADKRGNKTPLQEDVTRVNKRDRDGECDIFTVVFNEQSVDFILRMDQDLKIHVEPLERTNVRIECEFSDDYEINGWVVTDETGNRYVYRQKEWNFNIAKEDAISFNGIRGESYISSWYLSCIEPCNGEAIVFNYIEDFLKGENQSEINITSFYSSYRSKYDYGKKMYERPFDFSKYKDRFDEAINEASSYLGGYSLEMQLNNQAYIYGVYTGWIRNPSFEAGVAAINSNFRIMGQLADFRNISGASNELVQTLNSLINMYQNSSSSNARMAASWFNIAKNYVIASLDEVSSISTKETSSCTGYDIHSPLLKNITCAGKFVEFVYVGGGKSKILASVRFEDMFKRRISEVAIGSANQLSYLIFLDRDGKEVNRMNFDYYQSPSDIVLQQDIWGYPMREQDQEGEEDEYFVDPEYSKVGSLKTIKMPEGGEIILDYEPNKGATLKLCGGIRIKSMVLKDNENVCDSIYYRYPLPGVSVYNKCSNSDVVTYAGFSDRITHSRVKYKGWAFLKTGNNGIYYPYVQEITCGKGTRAYLFNIPVVREQDVYAFWMAGIPVATAIYDDSGNMKRLIKYKYSSDVEFSEITSTDYFDAIDSVLSYKYVIPQVKASEYYMDAEYLAEYYKRQGRVLLYKNGTMVCDFSPYDDIYLRNIQPRTNVQLPNQVYHVCYGGKTLLKEQVEYRFETLVTDSPDYTDFFTKASGVPFQKIEYIYDNIEGSVYPTRIVKTDSKGEAHVTVTKRVTEISDDANPVIGKMKQKNILLPVIKELQLKDNMIQVEKVACFDSFEADSNSYIGLSEQYVYYPNTNKIAYPLFPDVNLFTYEKENYLLEQVVDFQSKNHKFLPVESKTNSGISSYCYDFNYDQVILKLKHAKYQSVAAVDLKKYREASVIQSEIAEIEHYNNAFQGFYNVYKGIDESLQPDEYKAYIQTVGHRSMIDLIYIVSTKKLMFFEEYKIIVDRLRANEGRYVEEFQQQYLKLAKTNVDLKDFKRQFSYIKRAIFDPIIFDIDFLKYNYISGQENYIDYSDPIEMTLLPDSKRLKLFVLSEGFGRISYSVTHSGGITSGAVELAGLPGYSMQVFNLDLTSYTGVTSVRLSKPNEYVAYVALVPDDAMFEAISYNLDGTIFCKFDQSGWLELNEYDAAGRLLRVKDKNGNVVKELQYNVVKNN